MRLTKTSQTRKCTVQDGVMPYLYAVICICIPYYYVVIQEVINLIPCKAVSSVAHFLYMPMGCILIWGGVYICRFQQISGRYLLIFKCHLI